MDINNRNTVSQKKTFQEKNFLIRSKLQKIRGYAVRRFFAEGQYVRFRNPVILTAGFGKAHIFLGFKFPEDHGGFYKGSFSLMLDKIALCAKLLHGTSDSDPADMVKIGKLRLRRDFFSGLISTVFDLLGDDIHKLLVKRLDRIFI